MQNQPVHQPELTRMLQAWRDGDASALEHLTPIVYAELHRIALSRMSRERSEHLLQPSALVNEAFLRLMGQAPPDTWANRSHFFAFASRLMRQILLDFARAQDTVKRGGRSPHLPLEEARLAPIDQSLHRVNLIDLDRAMEELAALDSRQAQIVELHYFGGLEYGDIASLLDVSLSTIMRDWRMARAWLHDRLIQPL